MVIFKCNPCGKPMVPLDLYLHWDTQNRHYNLQTPDYIGTALCDGYNFFVPYERTTVRPSRSSTETDTAHDLYTSACALKSRCDLSQRSSLYVDLKMRYDLRETPSSHLDDPRDCWHPQK